MISLTIRKCSAVSGCSYMKVFMAGKIYVGVVGDRARMRDVCRKGLLQHACDSESWSLQPGCRTDRGQSLRACLLSTERQEQCLPSVVTQYGV